MPNEPNPLDDRIHIEQLEISARIGVPEKERSPPQRLTVSISFWPYQEIRDVAWEYRSLRKSKITLCSNVLFSTSRSALSPC